jgi:hypothetical protein
MTRVAARTGDCVHHPVAFHKVLHGRLYQAERRFWYVSWFKRRHNVRFLGALHGNRRAGILRPAPGCGAAQVPLYQQKPTAHQQHANSAQRVRTQAGCAGALVCSRIFGVTHRLRGDRADGAGSSSSAGLVPAPAAAVPPACAACARAGPAAAARSAVHVLRLMAWHAALDLSKAKGLPRARSMPCSWDGKAHLSNQAPAPTAHIILLPSRRGAASGRNSAPAF